MTYHEMTRKLATLALQIAAEAPPVFSAGRNGVEHSTTTYVRRSIVREIRATCEAGGIDWRKLNRQVRAAAAKDRHERNVAYLAKLEAQK